MRPPLRHGDRLLLWLCVGVVSAATVAMLPGPRSSDLVAFAVESGVYDALWGLGVLLSVTLLFVWGARARRDRLAWRLLTLGVVAHLVGDLLWVTHVSLLTPVPYPSVADVAYLAKFPLTYVGLLLLLRHRVRRLPTAVWLDGLVSGLGLASLAAAFVLAPILQLSGGRLAEAVTRLAYPIGDLVLLAVVTAALGLLGWRANLGWWLLLAGFGLLAATEGVYLVQLAEDSYTSPSLLDAGWLVSFLLIALAARACTRPAYRTEPTDPTDPTGAADPGAQSPEAPSLAAVPLLFAAASLLMLVLADGRQPWAVTSLAGLTVAATLVRLAVTIRQTRTLAQSRAQARTDELTGLPNRRAFYERAATPAATAGVPATAGAGAANAASHGARALLLVDLDRFKEVNDSLGHLMGDELLRQVGPRLTAEVGGLDLIARLGGDEFGVMLSDADTAAAVAVAERLCRALDQPFTLGEVSVQVAASIGIARSPQDGTDVSDLLQRADVAMYAAKAERTGWRLYDADEDRNSPGRLQLLEELRSALSAGTQLELHYQPKLRLVDGTVSGVEALVRWRHPRRGLLYPDAFLTLVEEHGLMNALTHQVLDQALRQCASWRAEGLDVAVAVNLSSTMVVDLDLPRNISDRLNLLGVPPAMLEIEITEAFLMSDWVRARAVLESVRALGVRVSVDDFGTGYSSLSYLRDLPIDQLKLDRSFIVPMQDDATAAALVMSTVSLAHSLGLQMVAEGIESEAVLQQLAGFGCDQAQGYHIGRPMPADELQTWLRARTGQGSARLRSSPA